MDKLYTPQEIADKLLIKKNTVYELIKRGELQSTKIGKQIRISQQDIDNYLNKSTDVTKQSISTIEATHSFTESSVIKRDYLKHSNGLILSGHDPILDFLCSQLKNHPNGLPTMRSQLGSYDSLYSLYFNKIHIAAVHLWDNELDNYNTSYIKHFLPGIETVILHFFNRLQGFYVLKNNPKNILTFKDLARKDITFVNRELGSGTRVLIDGHLQLNQISPDIVNGYDKEVLSHFASAASVTAKEADVAVGCVSNLGQFPMLDFIPIQSESYDLVFLKKDFEKPAYQAILELLNSQVFRSYLSGLYGYDISNMGNYTFV